MDQDRIVAFETKTRNEIDALQAKLTAGVKELREDALRTAVEDMSSKIDRRLAGIEARLTELEKADEE